MKTGNRSAEKKVELMSNGPDLRAQAPPLTCLLTCKIPEASPRPAPDDPVVDIMKRKEKRDADQRLRKWGRLDSNQRPIDYESIALTN
jgi:hypothetical protein